MVLSKLKWGTQLETWNILFTLIEFIYLLNIVHEGAQFDVSFKSSSSCRMGRMFMIQSICCLLIEYLPNATSSVKH